MNVISVTAVVVLFFLVYIRFIVLNRDELMRSDRAYGEILELIDWEWEKTRNFIARFEAKFGSERFSDAQIYSFLRLLVKDKKIEQRERYQDFSSDGKSGEVAERRLRVLEIRKLPAPSENDPHPG